jgi:hypothetical protein
MDDNASRGGSRRGRRENMSIVPIRRNRNRMLDHDSFFDDQRRLVLRQSGFRASWVCACSFPDAACAVDRDRANIDRWVGCP